MANAAEQDPTPTERFARMMSGMQATDIQDGGGPYDTYDFPAVFSQPPLLKDDLETASSLAQDAVAETCRKFMSGEEHESAELGSHGIPALRRAKHVQFMQKSLGAYPAPYQAMDASRPWILYWALAGLAHVGQDVSVHRRALMDTLGPLQNATGGFGGGHGQTSHVAAAYAAVLALALVDGLEMVDRRAMWQWLGGLKRGDGGFALADGGEVDVRGAYCALVIASLLNLPLDLPAGAPARRAGVARLTDRIGEWVGGCQTFEGGIGAAPDLEAHGAYAFCGLACLAIIDAPARSIPRYLDVDRLVHWLASRQTAPEGGFSGRTNKLVDACYSHWVGGCWALLEAAVFGGGGGGGVDDAACLWNRQGLVRYTLCCSQDRKGGLRDKPGTRQDGYHTNYSLAGLSAAQNHWRYIGDDGGGGEHPNLRSAFLWRPREATEDERRAWAFDERDTVGYVHPVFVVPPEVVARTQRQFADVIGF